MPGRVGFYALVGQSGARGVAAQHLTEPMPLNLSLAGYGTPTVIEALELRHTDLHAVNTQDQPDAVSPQPLAGVSVGPDHVSATLAPASWNMIRLGRTG